MLYGRDREREQIGELLKAARSSRSGALVVRGEPGVGKSALLEDTRERAEDMHVLTARGVESESELPFAALHQLLRSSLDRADALPVPQAQALRGALGLAESTTQERFLVSAACLSLLSELADRRPVLCLVDDAHWLDTPSAEALLFVARRLDAEGIVILFGAREGDVRTFEARDIPTLVVEGLDAQSSAKLLARTAGVEVSTGVVGRLVEQTHGNALALLELPSTLNAAQLAGTEPLPEALPMTRQVERIFLERLLRLPEATQRLMLVAAADDSEDLNLVLRAAERYGAGSDALDAAEQAGLMTAHGTRLEFRHPLVRSAAYGAATSSERRAAHRALADALGEGEDDRRAWHLASSVLDRDEGVALLVERVADRAEERGGFASAAQALERAAELSPEERVRGRRLVAAARAASRAGHDDRAVALAARAGEIDPDPEERAEIARVRGLSELRRGRPLDGLPMLIDGARTVAAASPQKAIELLVNATSPASQGGDPRRQLEIANLAASIVPGEGDEKSAFIVNLLTGLAANLAGESAKGAPLIEAAIAWGSGSDDPVDVLHAGLGALWLGDDPRFEELIGRAGSIARERGEIGTLAQALTLRAVQLGVVQRYDDALVAAREAVELARELGAENYAVLPRTLLALVAAVRGDLEEARREANDVLELSAARALPLRVSGARFALGMADMSEGRWADALERFDAVVREDPPLIQFIGPDRIEAAVRASQPDTARETLALFESWATQTGSPAARPRVAAGRALLAGGDEATKHFEEALQHADDARPFDLARIHLLYGEHLRRERRRTDARAQLRLALDGFERMRAAPWAERAAAELRATGETARKRDPSTFAQLTPQELQISRLVAEGMSNKEVAAHLFLSPRTVDYHLRHVFAKLGLTSRTQLARVPLASDEVAAVTA